MGWLGTSSRATSTPKRFASTEPSDLIFISPKPGSPPMRLRRSLPSAASVQMRDASPPYSSATVAARSRTRVAIEPGKRWIAGFSRKSGSRSACGDLRRLERPEPLLQPQRPEERLLDRDLLVEREPDQQGKRVVREEPARLLVVGEPERLGHAPMLPARYFE